MWQVWQKPIICGNLGIPLWRSEIWYWDLVHRRREKNYLGKLEERRVSHKVNIRVRWSYKCPIQTPCKEGLDPPAFSIVDKLFRHCLSCRENVTLAQGYVLFCTCRPTLMGCFCFIAACIVGWGCQACITAWFLPSSQSCSLPLPFMGVDSRTLPNKHPEH